MGFTYCVFPEGQLLLISPLYLGQLSNAADAHVEGVGVGVTDTRVGLGSDGDEEGSGVSIGTDELIDCSAATELEDTG